MDSYLIHAGASPESRVRVHGARNAALLILTASLLKLELNSPGAKVEMLSCSLSSQGVRQEQPCITM